MSFSSLSSVRKVSYLRSFSTFRPNFSITMSKRGASSTTERNKKRRKVTPSVESRDEVTCLVDNVAKELRKNADHKRSQPMKKYMRDQFEFFGLSSPLRRSVCKEFLQQKLNSEDVRRFATLLWEKSEREFQYFAVDYLAKNMDTSKEFEANMSCVEGLITTKSWWDTVDLLASKIIGQLVKQHRVLGKAVMEDWINHENMWLRRTALLHQLSFKNDTDEEMLFRFCSSRAHEEEFFIRKAIGWALRQHAYTSSANVKKYLLKHKKELSSLSFKEAAKHLNL